MALRAGYYGLKSKILNKVNKWDQIVFPRSEQAIMGATNILKVTAVSQTIQDVVYVVADDGITTANRSEAGSQSQLALATITLKAGTYKLCGFPNVSGVGQLHLYKNGYLAVDTGDGAVFTLSEDTSGIIVVLRINANAKVTDLVVKPMITLNLSAKYSDFVPFSMTNSELTASAADQKTTINAIITAATGAADFAAFKTAMGAITPVTRSLSKEASPEDVPEEVIEEEKPVTKKTTKKTVKEGE